MRRPRRYLSLGEKLAADSTGLNHEDTAGNAATRASTPSAAGRDTRATIEPSDLDPTDYEPPGSERPEPGYPGPAWPGGRRPSYVIVLAVSPWYKEHYPENAENLWDALHAGGTPQQPRPEPFKPADREAGE